MSRRWLVLMALLGVFWLAAGVGVRFGLASTVVSEVVGNGLLAGGVLTVLVAVVAHLRTVMSLPGKEIAAVNLAYAGRVIDGQDARLGSGS